MFIHYVYIIIIFGQHFYVYALCLYNYTLCMYINFLSTLFSHTRSKAHAAAENDRSLGQKFGQSAACHSDPHLMAWCQILESKHTKSANLRDGSLGNPSCIIVDPTDPCRGMIHRLTALELAATQVRHDLCIFIIHCKLFCIIIHCIHADVHCMIQLSSSNVVLSRAIRPLSKSPKFPTGKEGGGALM